jgi:hypothetical protein
MNILRLKEVAKKKSSAGSARYNIHVDSSKRTRLGDQFIRNLSSDL